MQIVTANQLQQWIAQGRIIEQDGRGPKVIAMNDGRLLKIFRPRRRLWLSRLRPQAQSFVRHAEQLAERRIATPGIGECFWIDRSQAVSACIYQPLPGTPLEQLFRHSRAEFDALLPELAVFIHQLHRRGIYFRSLHLGNILRLPDGGFGLIDFLDIRFKRGPLGPLLVRRNLAHLHGYLKRNRIQDFPWQALLQAYDRLHEAVALRDGTADP